MKKKTLLIICFAAAAVLAALSVLTNSFPDIFSSITAFPFEQIAAGLGLLSKAGWVGKGLAVALWIGISAIPAMFALGYKKGKETRAERAALYFLSAAILLAFYGMVNAPVFFPLSLDGSFDPSKLIKSIFGISVWSVAVLYVVLLLIRLFRQGDKERLFKYTRVALSALCVIFAAAAAVSCVDCLTPLGSAQTAVDVGFGIVLAVLTPVPYIFDIAIIIRALDLFDIALEDNAEDIVEAANRVSRVCCAALGVSTAITAISNFLQIALMRWLSNVSVKVNVPVISIAFTVFVLLFSRLIAENKKLRDENDMII